MSKHTGPYAQAMAVTAGVNSGRKILHVAKQQKVKREQRKTFIACLVDAITEENGLITLEDLEEIIEELKTQRDKVEACAGA